MGSSVHSSPEGQGVCYLSMKPYRLIKWQELDLWSDDLQYVPTHRQQNRCNIYRHNQSSTSRYPHRECELVETRKPWVLHLLQPMEDVLVL